MAWQERFTRDEMLAEVRRLVYGEGMSASQAAKTIGYGTTKNMVIRKMAEIRSATPAETIWPSKPNPGNDTVDDIPEETYGPVHLTRIDHGHTHCRAPLWPDFVGSSRKVDPSEHLFCGQKCMTGAAYCEEHQEAFYPKELQKKKARSRRDEVKDNSHHFQ
jgi:hypothetical protein